jgi:hypothetical protein
MPGALVRMTPPISPYTPVLAGATTLPTGVVASATPATSTIATSSGQNDGGLFEVKLHDERWLPFEGQGAISQWQLTLDQRDNAFDLSTVTDVILHVRYTARNAGGNPDAVRAALKPTDPRYVLISVRNTFGDDYFTFFNPTDPTSTTQTLTLPLTDALFPFSNLGAPKLQSITVLVMPTTAQPIGTTLATTFGPTAPGSALPIITVADSSGNPVAAMSSAELAFTPAVAAETLVLSLPSSGVPAPTVPPAPPSLGVQVGGITRLDQNQIDDVLLVIKYGLG